MRKSICTILVMVICMGMIACGATDDVDDKAIFQVNYINKEETKVIPTEYIMQADLSDGKAQVEELLTALGTENDAITYKTPLNNDIQVVKFELKEGNLVLDMNEKYAELPVPLEVLTRAALVRTLMQVDEVQYVGITVNGNPLTDNLGSPVGMMNTDTFVDNEGSQINSMEETRIRLYFADETGTGLVSVNRTLIYNTNISMEKLVVDQLIAGPTEMTKGVYATLSNDTKVLSVAINDGTCYVNFDDTFMNQVYNATAEVVIYSIVNSLAELPNVNKVQFSVNGETDIMYRETISLNTVFERNLDFVGNPE